jgi:Tfp pilus assembly protein PilN
VSSQVNLLPPEVLQGQRYRRVTLMVVIAGAVVLALVLAFFLLQAQRLSSVNNQIEAQQTTNNQIQQEIANLQKYQDLKTEAETKQALLNAAYANEVSFSALLMDLSRVTPSASYLDTLAITIQPPATAGSTTATSPTTTGASFVGSMTFGGQAIGFDTISAWLTRLEQVNGWANPWMSTLNKQDTNNAITFSGSVDLTQAVVTQRGSGGSSGAG